MLVRCLKLGHHVGFLKTLKGTFYNICRSSISIFNIRSICRYSVYSIYWNRLGSIKTCTDSLQTLSCLSLNVYIQIFIPIDIVSFFFCYSNVQQRNFGRKRNSTQVGNYAAKTLKSLVCDIKQLSIKVTIDRIKLRHCCWRANATVWVREVWGAKVREVRTDLWMNGILSLLTSHIVKLNIQ